MALPRTERRSRRTPHAVQSTRGVLVSSSSASQTDTSLHRSESSRITSLRRSDVLVHAQQAHTTTTTSTYRPGRAGRASRGIATVMDRPKPAEEGEDAVAEKPAEAVDGAGSATPATPSRATSDKRDAYAQRDEDGDSPIPTIENDEPPPALLSPSSESENALESALPRGHTRVSIYVQVFTEMIETVLENESFLFNQEELDMIQRFQGMSCEFRDSPPLQRKRGCSHTK